MTPPRQEETGEVDAPVTGRTVPFRLSCHPVGAVLQRGRERCPINQFA